MKEGDFVRVRFGVRDKTYKRKAIVLDIQDVPHGDATIEKYEIRMVKTGENIYCTKDVIEEWI